jgi:hypothetical protein
MFAGFSDNDDVLCHNAARRSNSCQRRLKLQASNQVKNAFQVLHDLEMGAGADVTFDFVANSLAAEAAGLPDPMSPTTKQRA